MMKLLRLAVYIPESLRHPGPEAVRQVDEGFPLPVVLDNVLISPRQPIKVVFGRLETTKPLHEDHVGALAHAQIPPFDVSSAAGAVTRLAHTAGDIWAVIKSERPVFHLSLSNFL